MKDASAIEAALRKIGFTVNALEDVGREFMENAIRTFGRTLRDGGVGLFFFAGHGVQLNGRNYLLPVDAVIGKLVRRPL